MATKSIDLQEMTESDLREHIVHARRELFGLRFQHATGELENTAGLRRAKQEIARALTVARLRGIEVQ
jgi:large subunit ribosomal protein L29